MQDRVSRNVLAGFTTQQNADCGVVALFAFKFIVHPNIHINLTDILMGDRAHLQVNQNIAFQFDVVEHKVDVIIFRVGHNMLLPGHKSKALAHFHEEVPDVRKDCRLQIGLCKGILGAESQKLCHNGTFKKFKLVFGFRHRFLFHLCHHSLFFRRMEQPIIIKKHGK